MDYIADVNGYELEFIEDGHIYLVDGVIVPSITQIARAGFKTYDSIPEKVLQRAAEKGTAVHEAIEAFCKSGTDSELPELRGFKALLRLHKLRVLENEVPVILFTDGDPVAAGRFDLEIEMDGNLGGADIKRTSSLDKEYLYRQLNLYRLANEQSYGIRWAFLKAFHLREDKRKLVDIPIAPYQEVLSWIP